MSSESEMRWELERLFEARQWDMAYWKACRIWEENPSSATANYIAARCEKMAGSLGLSKCKLAILRNFTVEPAIALLKAEAFVAGIHLDVQLGEFNTVTGALLNDDGPLYRFEPDIVILAILARDNTTLWDGFTDMTPMAVKVECSRVKTTYKNWIQAFRKRSKSGLVVHNLEMPTWLSAGILDHQTEFGQSAAIQDINSFLQQEAMENSGVFVLDYDGLVARHGRIGWHDEKKWLSMRMPIAAPHLPNLAREWMRHVRLLTGRICKVLVTDLDNTLWGGVIGEDGLEGIKVGPEHPGAYYWNLQRCLLDIKNRGVLLAVCSKNNPEEALEVFDRHTGMLLQRHHISSWRINWNDKAQSLREISAELNVSTDTLAFLDDNPVERVHVKNELPEIMVLDLPDDPAQFANVVRDSQIFERHFLSNEDAARAEYYARDRNRTELRSDSPTLDEFYFSLEQEVEVAFVNAHTTARVAQLTQKTNQFNLTTRRYTALQITEMASRADTRVLYAHVKDRFGDNGIIGASIIKLTGEVCEIDTFLLSCRVIGRTVETAFMAVVAGVARKCGARRLKGLYIPTRKNQPAKDFLAQHGFEQVSNVDSAVEWELDLESKSIELPKWIRLKFTSYSLINDE